MRKIAFVMIAIVGMSSTCTKKSSTGEDQSYLIGTWKLSEQYSDPGNGQGIWQAYTGDLRHYTFDADGRFSSTQPLQTKEYNRFKLIDERTIQFYNEGLQDSAEHPFIYENNKLTIWLQCIEECKIRLVRSGTK